jgi:hypothetical protein
VLTWLNINIRAKNNISYAELIIEFPPQPSMASYRRNICKVIEGRILLWLKAYDNFFASKIRPAKIPEDLGIFSGFSRIYLGKILKITFCVCWCYVYSGEYDVVTCIPKVASSIPTVIRQTFQLARGVDVHSE